MKYTALLVFVGITSFLAGGIMGGSAVHVETPTAEYNRGFERGFRLGYETGVHDAGVEKANELRLPREASDASGTVGSSDWGR